MHGLFFFPSFLHLLNCLYLDMSPLAFALLCAPDPATNCLKALKSLSVFSFLSYQCQHEKPIKDNNQRDIPGKEVPFFFFFFSLGGGCCDAGNRLPCPGQLPQCGWTFIYIMICFPIKFHSLIPVTQGHLGR